MTLLRKIKIQGTDEDGNLVDAMVTADMELKVINDTQNTLSEKSNLNEYTQLELLTLMYEELQQINIRLKKIYQ